MKSPMNVCNTFLYGLVCHSEHVSSCWWRGLKSQEITKVIVGVTFVHRTRGTVGPRCRHCSRTGIRKQKAYWVQWQAEIKTEITVYREKAKYKIQRNRQGAEKQKGKHTWDARTTHIGKTTNQQRQRGTQRLQYTRKGRLTRNR